MALRPQGILLFVLACLVLSAPPAAAHAYLVEADPGPNDRVEDSPVEIRMEFAERLEPRYCRVNVTDAQGVEYVSGPLRFSRDEPNVMFVPLATLPPGAYTVRWSTLSLDAHGAGGFYVFNVAQDAP